tara:strand:- start:2303 stop:2497 length:195 start_codon:yes stop_codon:yes gene_type:complete
MLIAQIHKVSADFFSHMGVVEDEVNILPLPFLGGLFPAVPNLNLLATNNITQFVAVRGFMVCGQ